MNDMIVKKLLKIKMSYIINKLKKKRVIIFTWPLLDTSNKIDSHIQTRHPMLCTRSSRLAVVCSLLVHAASSASHLLPAYIWCGRLPGYSRIYPAR